MSAARERAGIIGVGAAACAACCAGPILGVLAAVGLGTVTGVMLLGPVGLAVSALVALAVLVRRRQRRSVGCSTAAAPVQVSLRANIGTDQRRSGLQQGAGLP